VFAEVKSANARACSSSLIIIIYSKNQIAKRLNLTQQFFPSISIIHGLLCSFPSSLLLLPLRFIQQIYMMLPHTIWCVEYRGHHIVGQLLKLKLLLALDTFGHTWPLRELKIDQVITLCAHDSGGTVHDQYVSAGLCNVSCYWVEVVEVGCPQQVCIVRHDKREETIAFQWGYTIWQLH
jgi:hypothetical protein